MPPDPVTPPDPEAPPLAVKPPDPDTPPEAPRPPVPVRVLSLPPEQAAKRIPSSESFAVSRIERDVFTS